MPATTGSAPVPSDALVFFGMTGGVLLLAYLMFPFPR